MVIELLIKSDIPNLRLFGLLLFLLFNAITDFLKVEVLPHLLALFDQILFQVEPSLFQKPFVYLGSIRQERLDRSKRAVKNLVLLRLLLPYPIPSIQAFEEIINRYVVGWGLPPF